MKCIICRHDKENMSREHVIPDSLGGSYVIESVCVDCNSMLGPQVDGPLVNHTLSSFHRFSEGIAGKSGKIPNPFAGMLFDKANPDRKARVDVDADGRSVPTYLPSVRYHRDAAGNVVSFDVSVDAKDESQLQVMLSKIAKRLGLSEAKIAQRGNLQRHSSDAGLTGRLHINMRDFKIGILKIAYEFAVDSLPSYFEHEDAVRISEILKNADYEKAADCVNLGNGLDDRIIQPFIGWLDLESAKHHLILTCFEGGLVCIVRLHGTFRIGVLLSRTRHLDKGDMIFCISDVRQRSYRKLRWLEAVSEVLGPVHHQYEYDFRTQQEMEVGRRVLEAVDFRHEGASAATTPLYDGSGALTGATLYDKLQSAEVEMEMGETELVVTYTFPDSEKVLIRALPSGRLLRIAQVRTFQARIGKL